MRDLPDYWRLFTVDEAENNSAAQKLHRPGSKPGKTERRRDRQVEVPKGGQDASKETEVEAKAETIFPSPLRKQLRKDIRSPGR